MFKLYHTHSKMVKKLAPVIWQEIQRARRVLLHLHPGPDGDCVGSALAFYHLLTDLDKKAVVIAGDSDKPGGLSQLPGFDKIQSVGFSEADLSGFELFISLDSSSLNQISSQSKVSFPAGLATINVDHHSSNTEYAEVNLVVSSYPATAQILYELFQLWPIKITPEIALCLFIGLYTDTGGFKYPRTTAKTLEAAARLAAINSNFPAIIFQLENSNEPENIRFIGLALSSLSLYFGGKVAVSEVSFEALQKEGIEKRHTEKAETASLLKSVAGWEIGASLVEAEPNLVHLSLRTRDPARFDLAELAQALGGGGHPAAAGARLKAPLKKVRDLLLETIRSACPDLGQIWAKPD